jgi:hypothetical protein
MASRGSNDTAKKGLSARFVIEGIAATLALTAVIGFIAYWLFTGAVGTIARLFPNSYPLLVLRTGFVAVVLLLTFIARLPRNPESFKEIRNSDWTMFTLGAVCLGIAVYGTGFWR